MTITRGTDVLVGMHGAGMAPYLDPTSLMSLDTIKLCQALFLELTFFLA